MINLTVKYQRPITKGSCKAVFVDGVRTPFVKSFGVFKDCDTLDLFSAVVSFGKPHTFAIYDINRRNNSHIVLFLNIQEAAVSISPILRKKTNITTLYNLILFLVSEEHMVTWCNCFNGKLRLDHIVSRVECGWLHLVQTLNIMENICPHS